MAYTSKFTGAEIDNAIENVDIQAERIDSIEENIYTGVLETLKPYEKGTGYIGANSGQMGTGSQYYAKYEASAGKTYYCTCTMLGSAGVAMAAFYDQGNTYLGYNGIKSDGTLTEYTEYEFVAPENTKYMILSSYRNNIVCKGYVKTYDDVLASLDNITLLEDSVNTLNSNFYEERTLSSTSHEYGYIDKDNGSLHEMQGFSVNTYKVRPNMTCYFTGYLYGSVGYPLATFYDANMTRLGRTDIISTSTKTYYSKEKFITPENCEYIKCSTYGTSGSIVNSVVFVGTSVGGSSLSTSPIVSDYFVGNSNYPLLDTDYAHIVCYGQSLSNGSDAPANVDTPINGVYMFGTIHGNWYSTTENQTITPLNMTNQSQHPIASAGNVFANLLRQHCSNDIGIILGSYGTGGQSIAQLMSTARQQEIKEDEGYEYDCVSSGKYAVFEEQVDKIAASVGAESKTISCPAIVYLQGERDYYSDASLGFDIEQPGSNAAAYSSGGDKDKYKRYMSMLKEDMQNKVMTAYGQTTKPLFCIYQVSGAFVQNTDGTINVAQLEFAQENEDVILIQTPYFVPNYNSGHLTTNGYRWLGEYIGKAIFESVCNRSKSFPLIPIDFDYENNNIIRIKLNKAVNGLTVDTFTRPDCSNANNLYGFTVYVNGAKYKPSSIKVYGDEIILKSSSTFGNMDSATSIKVCYAMKDATGKGNIRDNCPYVSLYNYLDDSADTGNGGSLTISHSSLDKNGDSIIGKKYPMYNWLCSFSKELIN